MQEKTEQKDSMNKKMFGLVNKTTFFPIVGGGLGSALFYMDLKKGVYRKQGSLVFKEGLGLIFLFSFAGIGIGSIADAYASKKPVDPLTKFGVTAGFAFGGVVSLMASAYPLRIPVREMIFLTLFSAAMGGSVGTTLNKTVFSK